MNPPQPSSFTSGAPKPTANSTALLDATLGYANAHYAKEDWAAARDFLSLAVQLAPEQPQIRAALGSLQYQLEDYGAAGGSFIVATAQSPNNPDLQTQLAMTYLKQNRAEAAEAALGRALALRPNDPTALKLLADSKRDRGRYQEAGMIYGGLINQHPDQVGVLLSLAKCFFEMGEREGAEATLRQLLTLDPGNEIARDNLLVVLGGPVPVARAQQSANTDPTSAEAGTGGKHTPPSALPPQKSHLSGNEFITRLLSSAYSNLNTDSYTPDLQGWMHPQFSAVFLEAVRALRVENLIIFEVGSWKGLSATTMAKLCKQIGQKCTIVAVDTWLGAPEFWTWGIDDPTRGGSLSLAHGYPRVFETFTKNVKCLGHADVIAPFPLSSMAAVEVFKYYGLCAHIIYIDASHEYESVAQDINGYWPLLKPGGVMLGDDYSSYWPGVKKAVDEFVQSKNLPLRLNEIVWSVCP